VGGDDDDDNDDDNIITNYLLDMKDVVGFDGINGTQRDNHRKT
jgi:hypothetical protein